MQMKAARPNNIPSKFINIRFYNCFWGYKNYTYRIPSPFTSSTPSISYSFCKASTNSVTE